MSPEFSINETGINSTLYKGKSRGFSFLKDISQDNIDFLMKNVKQRCPINDNLNNKTPIHYNHKTSAVKTEVNA